MTELTNDEIIKALECCVSDDGVAQGQRPCKECPLLQDDVCSDSLRKLSLDLIKRTKLESKKYRGKCTAQKRELTRLYEETNRQKAEIDRYKGVIKILEKDVADARNEGAKDFGKYLIDKCVKGMITAGDIVDYCYDFTHEVTKIEQVEAGDI